MSVGIVCVKALEISTLSKIFPFLVGAISDTPLLLPSSLTFPDKSDATGHDITRKS
ncbi:MAG: hypothetical protein AB4080_13910 [Trichodesmium sp.]